MFVQTTPTLPVQTVPAAIPASPVEIHPNTSIADLNAIKAAWTQSAREAGYPEIVYNVTSRLGQEVVTRSRGHVNRVWSSGNVYAITREFTERYTLADGTHQVSCYLSVYVGEPEPERDGLVEQIVLSSKMFNVAQWRWNLLGGETTEKEGNFLIPGKWLNAFLAMEAAANQSALQDDSANEEEERQSLLTELLAGQDI